MPPQIFKNRVIATAGPLPGQLTVENLKRWTANRRGRFSEELTDEVTHLLCTRTQFRKRVPRVKEGLQFKEKKLHIVHCDWFEESAVLNRRLPEAEYSMRRREAERRAAEREERRVERGKANGEKFVNTNFYHIYRDRHFFPNQIELVQYDEETGNVAYKYTLCLWESNAKPHLHWFTAKLLDKNPGKANVPKYHRGSTHAVKWRTAFDQFTSMFEKLCKFRWEDRVSKQMTVPLAFQYLPPVGGKPVGRRLRHPHEYCLEINASLRGLPWPPIKDEEQPIVARNDDANEVLAEERIDKDVDFVSARVHDDNDNDTDKDCDEVVMSFPSMSKDIDIEKPMLSDENVEEIFQVEAHDEETEECQSVAGENEADAMEYGVEDGNMDQKDCNLSDTDSGIDLSVADAVMTDSD